MYEVIWLAILNSDVESLRNALESNPDLRSFDRKKTIMNEVISIGNLEIIDMLLNYDLDLLIIPDQSGVTAIELASSSYSKEVIDLIMDKYLNNEGAVVEFLQKAISYGQLGVVKLLLKEKVSLLASAISMKDLYDLAFEAEQKEVAVFLHENHDYFEDFAYQNQPAIQVIAQDMDEKSIASNEEVPLSREEYDVSRILASMSGSNSVPESLVKENQAITQDGGDDYYDSSDTEEEILGNGMIPPHVPSTFVPDIKIKYHVETDDTKLLVARDENLQALKELLRSVEGNRAKIIKTLVTKYPSLLDFKKEDTISIDGEEMPGSMLKTKVIKFAMSKPNLDVLKVIFRKGKPIIKRNDFDLKEILQFAYDQYKEDRNKDQYKHNYQDNLSYLLQRYKVQGKSDGFCFKFLNQIVEDDDLKVFKLIIDKNTELIRETQQMETHSLIKAARGGKLEIVKYLVDKLDAELTDAMNFRGLADVLKRSLIASVNSGHVDIIEFLTKEKKHLLNENIIYNFIRGVNEIKYKVIKGLLGVFNYNEANIRILHKIIDRNKLEEMEHICKFYNIDKGINSDNKDIWLNLISKAISNNSFKAFQFFLEKGFFAHSALLSEVLARSVQMGRVKFVKYFIEKTEEYSLGTENIISHPLQGDKAAFHYALYGGNLEICKFFLSKFPDVINIKHQDENTIAHIVALEENYQALGMLIALDNNILYAKNAEGLYPMDYVDVATVFQLPIKGNDKNYSGFFKNAMAWNLAKSSINRINKELNIITNDESATEFKSFLKLISKFTKESSIYSWPHSKEDFELLTNEIVKQYQVGCNDDFNLRYVPVHNSLKSYFAQRKNIDLPHNSDQSTSEEEGEYIIDEDAPGSDIQSSSDNNRVIIDLTDHVQSIVIDNEVPSSSGSQSSSDTNQAVVNLTGQDESTQRQFASLRSAIRMKSKVDAKKIINSLPLSTEQILKLFIDEGDFEAIEFLVRKNGALIKPKSQLETEGILQYAYTKGQLEILHHIRGICSLVYPKILDSGIALLNTVAAAGDVEMLKSLNARNPELIHKVSSNFEHALVVAAENGQLNAVKYLSSKLTHYKFTKFFHEAFIKSVQNGHSEVVDFLLGGIDSLNLEGYENNNNFLNYLLVNMNNGDFSKIIHTYKQDHGFSHNDISSLKLFFTVVSHGSIEDVKFISQYYNINEEIKKNPEFWVKIFEAALKRNYPDVEIARFLLNECFANDESFDAQALKNAALFNRIDIIQYIFYKASTKHDLYFSTLLINLDITGENALHSAILGGNVRIIEFILSKSLDYDILKKTFNGNTALHLAVIASNYDPFSIMGGNYGAYKLIKNLNPSFLYEANDEGLYPMHLLQDVKFHRSKVRQNDDYCEMYIDAKSFSIATEVMNELINYYNIPNSADVNVELLTLFDAVNRQFKAYQYLLQNITVSSLKWLLGNLSEEIFKSLKQLKSDELGSIYWYQCASIILKSILQKSSIDNFGNDVCNEERVSVRRDDDNEDDQNPDPNSNSNHEQSSSSTFSGSRRKNTDSSSNSQQNHKSSKASHNSDALEHRSSNDDDSYVNLLGGYDDFNIPQYQRIVDEQFYTINKGFGLSTPIVTDVFANIESEQQEHFDAETQVQKAPESAYDSITDEVVQFVNDNQPIVLAHDQPRQLPNNSGTALSLFLTTAATMFVIGISYYAHMQSYQSHSYGRKVKKAIAGASVSAYATTKEVDEWLSSFDIDTDEIFSISSLDIKQKPELCYSFEEELNNDANDLLTSDFGDLM